MALACIYILINVVSGCTKRSVLIVPDRERLEDMLCDLDTQTLVVRLYTNSKKERILKASPSLQDDYETFLKDRNFYLNTMYTAWDSMYTFSDLVFVPDSLWNDFKNGKPMVFSDPKTRQLSDKFAIKTPSYYVLARGKRDFGFNFLDSHDHEVYPQPPVNFNRLQPMELIVGQDEYLFMRVADLNRYFHNVVQKRKFDDTRD